MHTTSYIVTVYDADTCKTVGSRAYKYLESAKKFARQCDEDDDHIVRLNKEITNEHGWPIYKEGLDY